MDIPYEIHELKAIVSHNLAYETSTITKECIETIASRSKILPEVLMAYLMTEGASTGHIRKNSNMTYDVGPMQINTIHWETFFDQYGIPPITLRFDGCTSLLAGSKLINRKFASYTRDDFDSWDVFFRVAANYHSTTVKHNESYQKKWIYHFTKIMEHGIEFEYK